MELNKYLIDDLCMIIYEYCPVCIHCYGTRQVYTDSVKQFGECVGCFLKRNECDRCYRIALFEPELEGPDLPSKIWRMDKHQEDCQYKNRPVDGVCYSRKGLLFRKKICKCTVNQYVYCSYCYYHIQNKEKFKWSGKREYRYKFSDWYVKNNEHIYY